MQDTLDDLTDGCATVKMSPNPLKCEVMIVCPPKRPIVFPALTLNDCHLPLVHKCKLLRVSINSDLNWNDHVKHMLSKSSKLFYILYRARQFNFSQKVMFTLYTWFIRTSLEYAAPVWHPGLTQAQHTQLERIQKRCFRIILGVNYMNYDNARALLNCDTLYQRREELTIRFGMNILKSPEHRHLLPPSMYEIHGRDTRRARKQLQSIRCRTERFKKSSIPYIVNKINAMSNS